MGLKRNRAGFFFVLCAFLMSGCATAGVMHGDPTADVLSGNPTAGVLRGIIFTWVHLPATRNLHMTPYPGDEKFSGKIVHIKEPFSGYNMYTEFSSNAIGDIARRHGLKKIYFADKEIFNVLGIWKTETIHVYGE